MMKFDTAFVLIPLLVVLACLTIPSSRAAESGEGWISLFDGKSLDGWKPAVENPDSWKVEDGVLMAVSGRCHLFYDGPVKNHDFKNFELQMDVKTTPGSNSVIYFHTEYQENGWPAKGYEAQINNTHEDWRKTGGLYAIVDVKEAPAKDNEWFHYYIKVQGKHIVISINGKTTVDYTEPENAERPEKMEGRLLSHGAFCLQAHDPKSKTYFKNIQVKPLAD